MSGIQFNDLTSYSIASYVIAFIVKEIKKVKMEYDRIWYEKRKYKIKQLTEVIEGLSKKVEDNKLMAAKINLLDGRGEEFNEKAADFNYQCELIRIHIDVRCLLINGLFKDGKQVIILDNIVSSVNDWEEEFDCINRKCVQLSLINEELTSDHYKNDDFISNTLKENHQYPYFKGEMEEFINGEWVEYKKAENRNEALDKFKTNCEDYRKSLILDIPKLGDLLDKISQYITELSCILEEEIERKPDSMFQILKKWISGANNEALKVKKSVEISQ